MRSEPHEEDANFNIVLRRGIVTSTNKGKHPEEERWVCKASEKEVHFDLNRAKEKNLEAKKNFIEASTLGSPGKRIETNASKEVDPSILGTFLKTCMKLLHDHKSIESLQELIEKCTNKEKTPTEQCTARNIGKHKA